LDVEIGMTEKELLRKAEEELGRLEEVLSAHNAAVAEENWERVHDLAHDLRWRVHKVLDVTRELFLLTEEVR